MVTWSLLKSLSQRAFVDLLDSIRALGAPFALLCLLMPSAAAANPFVCNPLLETSERGYVQLINHYMSSQAAPETKQALIRRITESVLPLKPIPRPLTSFDVSMSQAFSKVMGAIPSDGWKRIVEQAVQIESASAKVESTRDGKSVETSRLLGFEKVVEPVALTSRSKSINLSMGSYGLAVHHNDTLDIYELQNNGHRRLLSQGPISEMGSPPLLFKTGPDTAHVITKTANNFIQIHRIHNRKVEFLGTQPFEAVSQMSHVETPDHRHLVIVQRAIGLNRSLVLQIYEYRPATGILEYVDRGNFAGWAKHFQAGEESESFVSLYSPVDGQMMVTVKLDRRTLKFVEIKEHVANVHLTFARRWVLRNGDAVVVHSGAGGLHIFGFEAETGLPEFDYQSILPLAVWGYSHAFPFRSNERDFVAAVSRERIQVFEIFDRQTVVAVANLPIELGDQRDGFSLHTTGDGRTIFLNSTGSRTSMYEFILATRKIEFVDSLQTSYWDVPYFQRSADGQDDFAFMIRDHQLESYSLSKRLSPIEIEIETGTVQVRPY